MNKLVLLGAILALGYSPQAKASLLINIAANGATASCNNSTVAGVTACGTAGFTTALNSNSILFGGSFSVGGYNFTGASGVTGNVPGDGIFGNLSDSKLAITHTSGAGDLTVEFAAWNYALPTGPSMTLSAASTGNWNVAAAGDNATFQAWARDDNAPTIPGGVTAIAPVCNSGGPGTTLACSTTSGDVPWLRTGGFYALTGREVIHQAIGSVASYQASVNTVASPVPEPTTLSMIGISLIGLGFIRRRQRQK
ncbi:MAG TPA: PEP-CTERM sorting domain-containing protein [Bryobacteraceae bacterium]|nr:PEP-CTERM sorting domain-containing protein [Bryobacteraceae bacterium]